MNPTRAALSAIVAATVVLAGACGTSTSSRPPTTRAPGASPPATYPKTSAFAIGVSQGHLVDGSGRAIQLRGVNRSGPEYACAQGWGIFDGPSDAASVIAMSTWRINAVRIPLNEDCWLGINGVNPQFSGANYRQAIEDFVALLGTAHIYAELDLAVVAPGSTKATGQQPMPDEDHSPEFWSSVASTFKQDPAVMFDLFNEPYPDDNRDTTAAWTCWRSGGTCPGVSYQAAGMAQLLGSVRSTGARNVVLLGGVQYAQTLDHWVANAPIDPTGQLVASFHNYGYPPCNNTGCWNRWVDDLGSVPLMTDEVGESDGGFGYVGAYLNWADGHDVSYLAWTWDTWGCGQAMALVTDYDGTPCLGYGSGYFAHLSADGG